MFPLQTSVCLISLCLWLQLRVALGQGSGTSLADRPTRALSPVIIIGGIGGSKIETRWQGGHHLAEDPACSRCPDWHTTWVNLTNFIPGRFECMVDELELLHDNNTGRSHLKPGIQVRIADQIEDMESLSDHRFGNYDYMRTLVTRLVGSLGYERNENIQAAAYDFRFAPHELQHYYRDLLRRVERMYLKSRRTPVTIVCHSMGCLNTLYFMHLQTSSWKSRHIRRVISMGAPWGGSVNALRVVALGYKMGLSSVERLTRRLFGSFSSTYFLLPRVSVYGGQPLVKTNADSMHLNGAELYTAKDMAELLAKTGHKHAISAWNATKDLLELEAPQVEWHCMFGEGYKTLARLQFSADFPSSKVTEFYEDGDKVVSLTSSSQCYKWKKEQAKPVKVYGFHEGHGDLVDSSEVLDKIEDILSQD